MHCKKIPIRIQLAGWYVLVLFLTVGSLATYLYVRLERKLIDKVDTALQIASAQSLVYLDKGDKLAFEKSEAQRSTAERLGQLGLTARLVTPQGQVVDGFGRYRDVPLQISQNGGYQTLVTAGTDWRLINHPIIRSGQIVGWLQIAQSIEPIEDIARELPTEIWLNLPLILVITALGGWFISNRSLSPIRQIHQTAQLITASDLSQRIHYQGAADEIGQLATTFNQMLDRLQAGFHREQRFTADAAHELRTPLTVIKGRIEVTRSRFRTVEEYDSVLEKLEQEVDRLIRLTNGLLLLARIDRGQVCPGLRPINLIDLLEAIAEQTAPIAEARNITFKTSLAADLWVQGDSDQLTSLFSNLLDNAVKYTPDAGLVEVSSKILASQIAIAVSNTGAVIPPEKLPHLFERFYRGESSRSQQGTGLGLAIAQEMARLHGGAITVESASRATTFTVTLPAA